MDKWTCHGCKKEFEEDATTPEEAIAELKRNFGEQWKPEDCYKVCDDCYNAFMERYAEK